MAINDLAQLPRAAFYGIEFPVESVRVRGGLRDHIHEYPHTPAGAAELMGRKVYEIEMAACFQTTFAKYPNLWPKRLGQLRKLFEKETRGPLVIPSIGTIDAYCRSWDQEMSGRTLSGERATFLFVEDQTKAFLAEQLVTVTIDALPQQHAKFQRLAASSSPRPNLFDQITDAINSVMAVVDTAEAYGGLLAMKVHAMSALIQEADQRLDLLNEPINHELLDALHELWASSRALEENLHRKLGRLVPFRVPALMPVSEVAFILYGSADRAAEILQLNPIEDAFAIPSGFELRVYEDIAA